jgi:hypothetical protein
MQDVVLFQKPKENACHATSANKKSKKRGSFNIVVLPNDALFEVTFISTIFIFNTVLTNLTELLDELKNHK